MIEVLGRRPSTTTRSAPKGNIMLEYIKTLLAARGREQGATAVEYGLLVALIAAAIVGLVFVLGGTVGDAFNDTNEGITNPVAPAPN